MIKKTTPPKKIFRVLYQNCTNSEVTDIKVSASLVKWLMGSKRHPKNYHRTHTIDYTEELLVLPKVY